ncbi:OLC1v1016722C1 [Oldenlandia corymbosa var. corymbosa]|uniref:OLC1v1016722C1 n=1 Tax=Oldenlandia corymbosa var. corymbosa TaxID=529605 RepID=A0AAV1E7V3_OLDCO|nr:OLC1v1016722C1 [Oldenlandia corymbosa var. corymbosa]
MLMASISPSNFTHTCLSDKTPISPNLLLSSCSVNFQFQPHNSQLRRCGAVRTSSEGRRSTEPYGAELLRKPVISPALEEEEEEEDGEDENGGGEDEETMIDWEEQILRDTVPLVNFVRMILHSGKYKSGDRLSTEHERTIVERLLPYHPEYELKIGSGIDYITVSGSSFRK